MKLNKISQKSIDEKIFELNDIGYTTIKNLIPQRIITRYLKLTKAIYKKRKTTSKHTPKVWNTADVIHNLQNKDLRYLKIIQSDLFDKILKKKLNDPHFRNLKKNQSNFILNNYQARSSGKGPLFLHIDSGIPTGDVTTFVQIAIPLEETNKKNGCTVVVPKSHKSKKFSDRETKNYKYLEGKPGDVFMWDGNLWHGSLPNISNKTRWSLIATFSNWKFKGTFDIPRTMKQKDYKKLNLKEKILLGYLSIPSHSEDHRVSSSIKTNRLHKKVSDYYQIN
tara:strand:+ start:6388 stop:7224 length:837 start_codon:yes stop_codon:yes gene_type:complete